MSQNHSRLQSNILKVAIFRLLLIEKRCAGDEVGAKLDHPVHDSKENLSGYDTLRCDSNGVTYYMKKDLRFTTKTLHWKEFDNLVFDILLPKSKPITKGVSYKPPNQTNFLDLRVEKCSNLNRKDNGIYLVDYFNINLLQNDNYILSGKRSTTSHGSVHTLISRYYRKFYQIYSLVPWLIRAVWNIL